MKQYTKQENALKEIETIEVEHTYDLAFLKTQKAQLEVELARVNSLLSECTKLGLEEVLAEVIE